MQQMQKMNDYCTLRENYLSQERRAAGEWDNTSSAITLFVRVAYNIFSTIEQKKTRKKQR
jgi:hypothetical protein